MPLSRLYIMISMAVMSVMYSRSKQDSEMIRLDVRQFE